MKWLASSPANIALIKYMGKRDDASNIPANASLSYTLPDFLSFVELEDYHGDSDYWEPLEMPGAAAFGFELSDQEQARFLAHLARIKQRFDVSQCFIVRSCNNFPSRTGLASSASSFSALTKVAVNAMTELMHLPEMDNMEIAKLSQLGSGSSIRSFVESWALWTPTELKKLDIPYHDLIHHAVIVTHQNKMVPSSEAHTRVKTSPLYAKRLENVEARLKNLIAALQAKKWEEAYQLCWDEFTEMHELFHTANPPFRYIEPKTQAVLDDLRAHWEANKDGPLVTIDAGPNIHLLFRPDQDILAEEMKEKFLKNYDVL